MWIIWPVRGEQYTSQEKDSSSSHTHTWSVTCVWAPKRCFHHPNRFTSHVGAWQDPGQSFFSSIYSTGLYRKVCLLHLRSFFLSTWSGSASPDGKHPARSAKEGGTRRQLGNLWCMSFIRLPVLKTNAVFHQKKDTSDHAHTLEHKVSANSQFVHSMEAYHQATNSAFLHWENKFYLLTCYQQQ